jgi:hypothetical protein
VFGRTLLLLWAERRRASGPELNLANSRGKSKHLWKGASHV